MKTTRLTQEQRDIINAQETHILVQASAGCGKTTTITNLIDNKINTEIQPQHITVLNYNNNNVAVMEEKLTAVKHGDQVNCQTIHSFSKSLVDKYYRLLGFNQKPKLVLDARKVITEITQQVLKTHRGKKFSTKDTEVKQLMKSVSEVRNGYKQITAVPSKELVEEILTGYQTISQENSTFDFCDMVTLAIELIKKSAVKKSIKKNIHTLIVDEVQDINRNQARLLVLLSKCVERCVFVGDEKQNINQFNGTRQGLPYLKEKVSPTLYPLSVSFRIPKQASSLVNKVAGDLGYSLPVSTTHEGSKSRLYRSQNNDEQFKIIMAEINRIVSAGTPLNQIAILGRTYSNLTGVAYLLQQHGIPVVESYNAIGNVSFEMVKSLLEIVKWYGEKKGTPPLTAITKIVELIELPTELQQNLIENIINEGWEAFKISGVNNPTLSRKVSKLRTQVILVAKSKFETRKALQILCGVIKPLVTLSQQRKLKPSAIVNRDFSLITVALSPYNSWEDMINNFPVFNVDTDNSIQLTTCHAAKGREWQYVFLINFVDGTFPHTNCYEEDERKLFYVAITRSSQSLVVIESQHVVNVNGENRRLDKTSPFISDYESEFEILPPILIG